MKLNLTPDEGLVVLAVLAALIVIGVIFGIHLALH
jgi:hypothetical protein